MIGFLICLCFFYLLRIFGIISHEITLSKQLYESKSCKKWNMIVHIYTSLIMQIHYNISLTFAESFIRDNLHSISFYINKKRFQNIFWFFFIWLSIFIWCSNFYIRQSFRIFRYLRILLKNEGKCVCMIMLVYM